MKKQRIWAVVLVLAMLLSFGAQADSYLSLQIGEHVYLFSNFKQFYKPDRIRLQATTFQEAMAAFPDVKTYVYLVNSSRTADPENITAEPEVYTAIRDNFTGSETDYLHLDSLEQYAEYFYTTDHHWSYRGSYAGYRRLVEMLLGPEEPVLEPEETVEFPMFFNGSLNKSINKTDSTERFTVYRFQFPEMSIEINGRPKPYGHQEDYFAGKYSKAKLTNHYAMFYGGDEGLIHIRTESAPERTLLVISNSMKNAVAFPLACHYRDVYFVDRRYYKISNGEEFILGEAVPEWSAGQVLILGDGQFFANDGAYK